MAQSQRIAWNYIIPILVFAFFIRILAVNQIMFGDELTFLDNVRLMGPYGLNPITLSSLFVPWMHWIEAYLFGLSPVVFKTFAVIFGTLTIFMAYLLTRTIANEKVARIAALLMAICSYHVFNSTIIGSDEPHLLLIFTACSYFYVRFLQEKKIKLFWTAAIVFGIGLLIKQTAVFILPILFLFEWQSTRKFRKSVVHGISFLVIGLVIFSVFPILSLIAHDASFFGGLHHTISKVTAASFDLSILAIQYMLSFIWMGPLLLGFIYLSFLNWKKHPLPSIWVWAMLFAFSFIDTEATKPLDRYFTILIVPLCILGAMWISELRFTKHDVSKLIAVSALATAFFFILNNLPGSYLPFYPKDAYLQHAASFDFNFFIPVMGGSGPIGFYLHALFVIAGFALGFLFFVFTPKNFRFRRIAAVLFLGISLAYGIVLTSEHLFAVSNPNVDLVNKEVISFVNQNNLTPPLFVFRNPAYVYYVGNDSGHYTYPGHYSNITILDYYVFDKENITQEIKTKHPSVIVIDFPMINRNSEFWRALSLCNTTKEFSDKGMTLGYVLSC